jgi:hypothetical protein
VDNADATLALERWPLFQDATGAEKRFRRRAYQRARDRALIAVALSAPGILQTIGTRRTAA